MQIRIPEHSGKDTAHRPTSGDVADRREHRFTQPHTSFSECWSSIESISQTGIITHSSLLASSYRLFVMSVLRNPVFHLMSNLTAIGGATIYLRSCHNANMEFHNYNLEEHEARMDELEGTLRGHIG